MKRNSRILAILLTLCLLFGVIATNVFAGSDLGVDQLVASQLSPAGANRFNVTSIGLGSYSTGNGRCNTASVDAKGNTFINVYNSGNKQNNSSYDSFLNIVTGDTVSTKIGANYSFFNADKIVNDYLNGTTLQDLIDKTCKK